MKVLILTSRTKEHDRTYQLARYHKRRRFMVKHLGEKCVKCGSVEDLEIDHIENLHDKIPISKFWGIALDRLLVELEGCQLLCGGCHTEKSVKERGHRRGFRHGTLYCYKRGGCRCDLCVGVNGKKSREYMKRYRDKLKNKVPSSSG